MKSNNKKAVLVTAVVQTRIIIDINDDEDSIIEQAKHRLLHNLRADYADCIESIQDDTVVKFGSLSTDMDVVTQEWE